MRHDKDYRPRKRLSAEDYPSIPSPEPHPAEAQREIDAAMQRLSAAHPGSVEYYARLGEAFEVLARAKGFAPERFVERLLPLRWGGGDD